MLFGSHKNNSVYHQVAITLYVLISVLLLACVLPRKPEAMWILVHFSTMVVCSFRLQTLLTHHRRVADHASWKHVRRLYNTVFFDEPVLHTDISDASDYDISDEAAFTRSPEPASASNFTELFQALLPDTSSSVNVDEADNPDPSLLSVLPDVLPFTPGQLTGMSLGCQEPFQGSFWITPHS